MKRPKPQPRPRIKVESKMHRRVIHGLWDRTVMASVWSAQSALRYVLSHHKKGLTEGEVKFIENRIDTLAGVGHDLNKVYYRLKFLDEG